MDALPPPLWVLYDPNRLPTSLNVQTSLASVVAIGRCENLRSLPLFRSENAADVYRRNRGLDSFRTWKIVDSVVMRWVLHELTYSAGERIQCVSGAFWVLLLGLLLVWGFALGTLGDDRKFIIEIAAGLGSGFTAWAFAGDLSVWANKHPILKVAVAATGGFAVWFLTHIFFLVRR
jgi:hypothetical protein